MCASSFCSVTAMAQLLQITPRRVQQLAAAGVIPKSQRGRYDPKAVLQSYRRFLQTRAKPLPIDAPERAQIERAFQRWLKKAKHRVKPQLLIVYAIRLLVTAWKLEQLLNP